jgi:hypothetical protein
MAHSKTGSGGGPWVELEAPRPPKVEDHYKYWGDPPPETSERCKWWLRQIERGWKPNRRVRAECYDCSAEWYGIYIWEFTELICPALQNGRMADLERAQEARRALIPLGPPTFEEWFMAELKKDMMNMLDEEIDRVVIYGEGNRNIHPYQL